MEITTVIPTRNRPQHMRTVLRSLSTQNLPANEIIVVDASDDYSYQPAMTKEFHMLPLIWLKSQPAVCIQRNIGISKAKGDWIFLCDDDIELPVNYLEQLADYARREATCGAVAGRLLQQERGQWVHQYPVVHFYDLVWRFVFQLSIWGSIDTIAAPYLLRPFYSVIMRRYRTRGNSRSLAGWPLVTQWDGEAIQTKFYSLGANLIRKEWLTASPYDEVLDPSGIGDNYGVAQGFPGEKPIHVLSATFAYHHLATENRLPRPLTHYRRALALHYFLKRNNSSFLTRLLFSWSLLGQATYYAFKNRGALASANVRVLLLVLMGKNPYWLAYRSNVKTAQPEL